MLVEVMEFAHEILDRVSIKEFSGHTFDIRLEKTSTTESEDWKSGRHRFDGSDPEILFSG